MATLVSPGIAVSVTDESFYTSAGPGTVPLIFIATASNKATPDGLSTAEGTLASNAGKMYLVSSQRELLQTFGDPNFNEVGGSAQHGHPLNEYGLLAAFSYLGIANRAYVVRADVDLAELQPSTVPPTAPPVNNTYWLDTSAFVAGLFKLVGGEWVESDVNVYLNPTNAAIGALPNSGFVDGDIMVSFDGDGDVIYYERVGGSWGQVSSASSFTWAPHTQVPLTTGAFDYWLKTTSPNNGLQIPLRVYNSTTGAFSNVSSVIVQQNHVDYYRDFDANSVAAGTVVAFVGGGDSLIAAQDETDFDGVGTPASPNGTFAGGTGYTDADVLTLSNGDIVTVDLVAGGVVTQFTVTTVTGNTLQGDVLTATGGSGNDFTLTAGAGNINFTSSQAGFTFEWHNGGSQVVVTGTSAVTDVDGTVTLNGVTLPIAAWVGATIDTVIQDINDEGIPGVVASKTLTNRLVITNTSGEDLTITSTGTFAADAGIQDGAYSNFAPLAAVAPAYVASPEEPTQTADEGAYWYNPTFDVDLMRNDGTGAWVELTVDTYVQPDEPTATNTGDLWIETDQVDEYPVIWRRTATGWVMIDNADQTTPNGIVFADARVTPGDALDADTPDPLLYPGGTLLWNTRYSGRNVKVWREDYTFAGTLVGDRWVSASGNREDGSPYMGLDAVKRVVVKQLAEQIQSNEEVRADTIFYNLLATPGFPELMDEMITLNLDRKEQAFIIGDTPFKLRNNSTELQAWATNANLATGNGDDGLVSSYPYLGVYYPSGLTSNTDGSEVVVPASHMMLRVMAFNDQVSYPWFAPAGFARGTVTNASSVGYISSEDEFVPVTLGEGLRDVLYLNNINPITFIPGRGLVVYGQKTRSPVESALDRVNVARLINYIRFQAERIAQPYLFEPNDSITRAAVKNSFDVFLAELITLRGLFDFLVVCDNSNNTPARIDRNELWVDIAIQPIKSVEFIYIPIRLQNTGADLAS